MVSTWGVSCLSSDNYLTIDSLAGSSAVSFRVSFRFLLIGQDAFWKKQTNTTSALDHESLAHALTTMWRFSSGWRCSLSTFPSGFRKKGRVLSNFASKKLGLNSFFLNSSQTFCNNYNHWANTGPNKFPCQNNLMTAEVKKSNRPRAISASGSSGSCKMMQQGLGDNPVKISESSVQLNTTQLIQ